MKNEKIIVSLTSFPARIGIVCQAIESILHQTVLPDKIVLYLAESQFPGRNVPASLATLAHKNPTFEIRWHDNDIRSFKKLVPALIDFPDDIIITFDDDLLYPNDLIARLVKKHKRYPNAICGCRVRRIITKNGAVEKYGKWRRYKKWRQILYGAWPKYKNMATTGAGTLFPPHALHPDVVRDDIFMSLCPTADDIWFWAMAVMAGTKTAPTWDQHIYLDVIDNSQVENLADENMRLNNLNDKYMKSILSRYPELREALKIRRE